jgi:hypothetical protein
MRMPNIATRLACTGGHKNATASELDTVVATVVVRPADEVTEAIELVSAGDELIVAEAGLLLEDVPLGEADAVVVGATGPLATLPTSAQGARGTWSPPR